MGYELETRPRWGWIEAGLGVSAAVYLSSGIIASMIDAGGTNGTSHRWLYLPVAGPFIAAANPRQGRNDHWTFILIIDGILQVAGLTAAIWGAVSPEEYLSRSLSVGPMALEDGIGVTLSGVTW